jgi:hypothetical protein
MSAQDAEKLRSLSRLNSEEFANMLGSVASGLGMNERQRESLISNSETLRRMLAGASDNDLKKLAGGLGKERTDAILGTVKSETDREN